MVYFKSFDEFFLQAQQLFQRDPAKTRCSFKFRQCDQKVELKVTDDRVCLKFKTDQQADVKRIEKLSGWFFLQATSPLPTEEDKA